MTVDEQIAELEMTRRALARQVEAMRYELLAAERRLDETERRLIDLDLRKAKYATRRTPEPTR